jgi:hypothetical protein
LYIGVLFPTKYLQFDVGKKKLGALPTRKAVYSLLRRIDWGKANKALAPLWDCLGQTPDLVVRRKFRNPKEIIGEFRVEQAQAEQDRRERRISEQKEKETTSGMSAAKAKRTGIVTSAQERYKKHRRTG